METAAHTTTPELVGQTTVRPGTHRGSEPRRVDTWLGRPAVDGAMLSLAAGAALLGRRFEGAETPGAGWIAAFCLACLACYALRGLYVDALRVMILDEVRQVVVSTVVVGALLVAAEAVAGSSNSAELGTLRLAGFACAYVAAGRAALSWTRQRARAEGDLLRPTLIVGAGKIGCVVARRLLSAPQLGLRPVAFLDKEPLVDTLREVGLPVVGASWDLDEAIERYGIRQVIVTFSTAPDDVLLRLVRRCEELGIHVSVVPRLFERMPERYTIDHVGGIALVSPRRANPHAWEFGVKYAIDRVVAALALAVLSPLLLLISLAVLGTMGRPVFFRQTRIGRDGRTFQMLKFRSMRPGAPGGGSHLHVVSDTGLGPGGVEGEDRRTRVGALLRRASLDELPQLINVLRGEMSLIGPRPERPEYVSEFERTVYRYGDRHRVKSGITGWAQVHGLRGRTSLTDRAEWDNFYIENFSLWLDVRIALMTLGAVFGAYRTVE